MSHFKSLVSLVIFCSLVGVWSWDLRAGGMRHFVPPTSTFPLPDPWAPPSEPVPYDCQVPGEVLLPNVTARFVFEKLPTYPRCDTQVRNTREVYDICYSVAERAGYSRSHSHYEVVCNLYDPSITQCQLSPSVFEHTTEVLTKIKFHPSAQSDTDLRCQFLNQCLATRLYDERLRRIAMQWHNQWRCPQI